MIGTVNSAQETRLDPRRAAALACALRTLLGRPGAAELPGARGSTTGRRRRRPPRAAAPCTARRVIVAIPPTLAGRIRYSPPLPGVRDQLTQRSFMGSVIKVHVVYERPFWREDGLSGHVTGDEGLVQITFDQSHPDRAEGVLVGFIDAEAARTAPS